LAGVGREKKGEKSGCLELQGTKADWGFVGKGAENRYPCLSFLRIKERAATPLRSPSSSSSRESKSKKREGRDSVRAGTKRKGSL